MKVRRVVVPKANLEAIRDNPNWTFYAGFSPLLSPSPRPNNEEEMIEVAIDPPFKEPPTPAGSSTPLTVKDGIVEAFKTCWGEGNHLQMAVAQAIEDRFETQEARVQTLLSKVGELEAEIKGMGKEIEADMLILNLSVEDLQRAVGTTQTEIEGVRKLFRNHEERLDSQKKVMEANFDAIAGQFRDDKRKVEHLDREVGHAHERCHDYWKYLHPLAKKAGLFDDQPQPSRAQARGKDGKMHDLKSGVSTYYCGGESFEKIFSHVEGDRFIWGYASLERSPRLSNEPWRSLLSNAIWLRDLDFPATGTTGRGK